jgi:hypothetical protein
MEIILKWFLEERLGGCGLDSSGPGKRPVVVVDSCEHGNEHLIPIKDGESLD